jgi:hypothetical protein
MIERLPPWIDPPSRSIRQTEVFRQWRALIRERIIQNPPPFLCHLSPPEIRETLATAEKAAATPGAKLTRLLLQIIAYERQVELIAWSPFIDMGHKLIRLRKKLAQTEFEKLLGHIGVTLKEAEVSMAAARQETA